MPLIQVTSGGQRSLLKKKLQVCESQQSCLFVGDQILIFHHNLQLWQCDFLDFFSYCVSHSWVIPMMKITGLSHLFKGENQHNWWLTKYFFAPLYIILYIKYVCRYIKTSCVRRWSRALVWICFSSCKLFSLSSFSCRLTSSTFPSAASWLAFRVFILYKTTNTAAAIDMTTSRAHNKWDTDVDANEVRLKVELRKLQSTLVRKQIFNIIK